MSGLREAIPFSFDSPKIFNAAVDTVMASLGDMVELLGFSEALHGGEDILILRNRLFQRLLQARGYGAIESSFPRARVVNESVAGHGSASYEAVQDLGLSHGFGRLDANRELVGWMQQYNADPAHHNKLHFYGFDNPTEMTGTDSPMQVLQLFLDYLTSIDRNNGQVYRRRIEPLLGQDADWENPATMLDPAKSIGRSPAAAALRIETKDLISELQARRPELVAKSGQSHHGEAARYAAAARRLLNFHFEMAGTSSERTASLLSIREAMIVDNLAYMVSRERGRGKVFAFAHNSYLQPERLNGSSAPTSPPGGRWARTSMSCSARAMPNRFSRRCFRCQWYWSARSRHA